MVTLTSPAKLANMVTFLETAPDGIVVEVGVFEGGSLEWLASRFPDRTFLGYDTFIGLPPSTEKDNFHREGHFACDLESVKKRFASLANVTLIQGVFPTSAVLNPGLNWIALAHVDVDLYEHTLASIRFLAPRMASGGRIYCDDAFVPTCRGATEAVEQFAAESGRPLLKEWPEHAYFQF